MGLRDTLNENPRITTGLTAGIIVVTVIALVYSMRGSPHAQSGGTVGNQAFFTDDDGKTWFADDGTKVPPFDHGGKQAVRAYVYKCSGKPFVNHMERYTPEGKKKVEELYAKKQIQNDPTMLSAAREAGMEVKTPGQKDWIKLNDPRATQAMQPKCPGGESIDKLEIVSP